MPTETKSLSCPECGYPAQSGHSKSCSKNDHPDAGAQENASAEMIEMDGVETAFAQDAIKNPEQINWDTITQEQRNAIVRAFECEPIDWQNMSEDEIRAAREADKQESLTNPIKHNPTEFTKQDMSRILRSSILQFGYYTDWENASYSYYNSDAENPTSTFEEMSKSPLNGDTRGHNIQTYTKRYIRSPFILALTKPDLQRRFDEIVTTAYHAAHSGDKAMMQSKLKELETIRDTARREFEERK